MSEDQGQGQGQGIFGDLEIENIDLQKGQRNFSGKVYVDVLRAWCKHIPGNMEKLRALAGGLSSEATLREYVTAVHGVKGASYGICADGIGKSAEALEAAARRGDLGFIAANNEPLVDKASRLFADLQKCLAAHVEKEGARIPASAPDPALLAELLAACRQFKSSAMEEILKKLDSFEYAAGGGLIPWLREQMDNLEYEAIEQRLTEEL